MNDFSDIIGDDEPPIRGGAQFVRLSVVSKLLGVSRPTIYKWAKSGEFPKPITIGSGRFWIKSEIVAWQAAKLAERE